MINSKTNAFDEDVVADQHRQFRIFSKFATKLERRDLPNENRIVRNGCRVVPDERKCRTAFARIVSPLAILFAPPTQLLLPRQISM